MNNRRMQEMLDAGEALDLSDCPRTAEGWYLLEGAVLKKFLELNDFDDGVDLCDKQKEAWIWSVGEEHTTGRVVASTDTALYENQLFHCLWLR